MSACMVPPWSQLSVLASTGALPSSGFQSSPFCWHAGAQVCVPHLVWSLAWNSELLLSHSGLPSARSLHIQLSLLQPLVLCPCYSPRMWHISLCVSFWEGSILWGCLRLDLPSPSRRHIFSGILLFWAGELHSASVAQDSSMLRHYTSAWGTWGLSPSAGTQPRMVLGPLSNGAQIARYPRVHVQACHPPPEAFP